MQAIIDKVIEKHSLKLSYFSLITGVVLTYKLVAATARFLRRHIIPGINMANRYGKGSYAVISACTDGIGKGFAMELASHGFNLVMLVRNGEKARAVEAEIRKNVREDIQVKIVEINFLASMNPGVMERAVEQIRDIDISILVNNVGMSFRNISIESNTEKELIDMITMNIGAQVLLTQKLLPQLRQRSSGHAAIINLSSVSRQFGFPGFGLYGGTKIFNHFFSESLAEEYKGEVDFLSVSPGWVNTPMTTGYKKTLEITPIECAQGTLKRLTRIHDTSGHWKHSLAWVLQGLSKQKIISKLRVIAQKERSQLQTSKQ